ncbi:MAG TPA: VWA domain-containing protein [Kofleriaceae bacterium]|nr:VWA domain-containing protein [Kofleriaceae bacterium]
MIVLAMLLGAGCGPSALQDDAGSEDGSTGGADARRGADAPPCSDVIDLVFVLDTSSSMGFVLQALENQIGQVAEAANQLAPDARFGLVVFQDNHWLDMTGPLEGGRAHTAAATLQTAFANYRTNFTDYNRNPGDGLQGPTTQNPICEENSLDGLYAAAAEFPWRDNATRVVILATDDTFLERPDNYGDRDGDGLTDKTDYPREGDYPALRTLSETVTALQTARIRVFSFTRLQPPGALDLTRCGTPRRLPWNDITDGWTTPYAGQAPIPEQTDARNFDLDAVRTGSLSLADTINEVVLDSYCVPPVL